MKSFHTFLTALQPEHSNSFLGIRLSQDFVAAVKGTGDLSLTAMAHGLRVMGHKQHYYLAGCQLALDAALAYSKKSPQIALHAALYIATYNTDTSGPQQPPAWSQTALLRMDYPYPFNVEIGLRAAHAIRTMLDDPEIDRPAEDIIEGELAVIRLFPLDSPRWKQSASKVLMILQGEENKGLTLEAASAIKQRVRPDTVLWRRADLLAQRYIPNEGSNITDNAGQVDQTEALDKRVIALRPRNNSEPRPVV